MSNLEMTGKVIAILAVQSGKGKNDTEWKKQDYVIETHDQYPKKMCFTLWGEKIDACSIKMSEELIVSFDIDCREWNGKWFNDVRAWKINRAGATEAQPQQQEAPVADSKSDLPF